jgi:hypothetical protein
MTPAASSIDTLFGLKNHCLPAHRKENINAPKTHSPIVANFEGAHQYRQIRQRSYVVVKLDEGAGERKRENAYAASFGRCRSYIVVDQIEQIVTFYVLLISLITAKNTVKIEIAERS